MALSQASCGFVPASVPGKAVIPVFLHLLHAPPCWHSSPVCCWVGLCLLTLFSSPCCHFELNSHGQTGKTIPASRNHQECASFISLPFLFSPLYLASCLSVWPAPGMLVPFYQRIQQLPSLHFRGVGGDGTVSPQRCSGIFFILSLNPFCT